jgi:hypothetical protein
LDPTPKNPLDALAGWSLEDKKRLLVALTRELGANSANHIVAVTDDSGTPLVYLLSVRDASTEYGAEWTVGYLLELQRRAATLDNSAPWSDVRGRLASGLGFA